MARTFDAGTERLTSTNSLTAPQSAGTVAFWLKPAFNSGDSTARYFLRTVLSSSPNVRDFVFLRWSANTINFGWNDLTAADFDELSVSDSGVFTSGTWVHMAATWSDAANTLEIFANASSLGTRTTGLATYSAGTGYDARVGGDGATDARSDMQAYAMWSSILSVDDLAALAKGFSPQMVSPATLETYLPLVGRQSPEIDIVTGQGFAVTGATQATHRSLFYPTAPQYPNVTTAAPPVVSYAPSNIIWF